MDVWWCTVVLLAALSYTGCAIAAVCDSSDVPSIYAIHPRPSEMDPLTNSDTLPQNVCSEDMAVAGGWLCLKSSVILDGNLGFQPSPSSALFFAWSRSSQVVSVTVRYFPSVTIRHVQLFFYNKPSMGIGLPDITLASSTTLPHYITGNQHLRSDDDGRRNVTLSLVDTSDLIANFTIMFNFGDSNRVDWLLLSEVRICQQPVTVLQPLATPQLVHATKVVRNASDVSANLTLSCTVSGEGRFSWMWTGPSPLSQVVLSDYTRTSTALFTDIRRVGMTKYHCQATYDPQIAGGMFAMSASQDFNVALEFVLDVVGPSTVRAALLEEVSLTCELYGYLESSDTAIIWTIKNVEIGDSNPLYRVDTVNGNNSIQIGGAISLPSIISVLTISANDNSLLTTYVCKATDTFIFKTITLKRKEPVTSAMFFQLKLTGVTNCGSWRSMDLVSKDLDVVEAIVKFMAANCDCDFTADRLTDRVFLCHPSSPQSVTYQAQLHGTLKASVADLIAMIQEWAFSGVTIQVQNLTLTLDGACVSSSSSSMECEATEMEDMSSTGLLPASVMIAVIGVLAVVIVLIIIPLIVIIVIVRVRSSKLNPKKESRRVVAIPNYNLTALTDSTHDYEYVTNYRLRNPPSTSEVDDIKTFPCPVYLSTMHQNQPPTDADDYELV